MSFGASTAINAAAQTSYRNLSSSSISVSAGSIVYSVLPNGIVTIPYVAASTSTDIANLLTSGTIQQIYVFGAAAPLAVTAGNPEANTLTNVSFTAATQSNITGSFYGLEIDSVTGRWLLNNGNQLIYPNSRVRQQPAPGQNSTITIGATFQRTNLEGGLGFAVYTDASTSGNIFQNGYLVLFESTGLCDIYSLKNGQWNNFVDISTQIPYPLDLNEHTLQVVVTQPSSSYLQIFGYVDGLVYAQGTISDDLFTNGVVGLSLIRGAGPVLMQQNSFEFTMGVDVHQNLPTSVQSIISPSTTTSGSGVLNLAEGQVTGQLPVAANSPSVLQGAITGTGTNLVPDSAFKFGTTLWNTSNAGGMLVENGIGVSGGKGVIYKVSTGPAQILGNISLSSSPISCTAGETFTISGNILATDVIGGGTGLPAWQLWSYVNGEPTTLLTSATQGLGEPVAGILTSQPGAARVQSTYTIAASATFTEVCVVAAANNCEVAGGGDLIWSEPQLEVGQYMTAYVANLASDQTSNLPLGSSPIEVISTIVANGSGGGSLLLGTAAAGSLAPYYVLPSQVSSVIASNITSTGTYLQNLTVGNSSINPSSVASTQAQSSTYTNETANVYNNLSSNYYWYLAGTGPITSSTTISDGSSILYSVGVTDPATTPAPALQTLTIAANSTITAVWTHPPFVSSSAGSAIVSFAGSQVALTAGILASSVISNSSSPSITSYQTQATTYPQFTGLLTDTGNPSITTSNIQTTTFVAATGVIIDNASVSISSSQNNVTTNTQFTSNTGVTSSTSGVSATPYTLTSIVAASGTISSTSTTSITQVSATGTQNQGYGSSGTVSGTATIAASGEQVSVNTPYSNSGTYSGNPAITSTTISSYSTVAASGSNYSVSLPVTVSPTPIMVQEPVLQNSGSLNGNYQSVASIANSGVNNTNSWGPVTINIPAIYFGEYATYTAGATNGCSGFKETGYQCLSSNFSTAIQSFNLTVPINANPGDIVVTLTGSSSTYNIVTGSSAGTQYMPPNVHGVGGGCVAVNAVLTTTTLTPYFNVVLTDPNGNTYSGIGAINGISFSNSNSGIAGTWKVAIYGYALYNGSTNVTGTTIGYTNGTLNGQGVALTASSSGSYPTSSEETITQGNYVALFSTPSNVVPPVNSATAITFQDVQIANVAGTQTAYFINNPSGTVMSGVTAGGGANYSYYNSSAAAGPYTVYYQTEVTSATNNGSYANNISGQLTYYLNENITTGYNSGSNTSSPYTITTASTTVAPSTTYPLTLNITNINLPSNGNGSSYIYVVLYNPNGTIVGNWNVVSNQTITFNTAGSPAGTFTWYLYSIANTTGGPGPFSYTPTCNAQAGWYQQNQTTVINYATTAGIAQNYSTSASTLAPTTSAIPVLLNITNTSIPSDANGSTELLIQLKNPSGNLVDFTSTAGNSTNGNLYVTGPVNCSYYNASATNGVYTWIVQAVIATDNFIASESYTVTAGVTTGWYQTGIINQYVYTDTNGSTTNFQTAINTTAPTSASTQLALIITNVSVTSNSYGQGGFLVNLLSPNSTVVKTWTITNNATLVYSAINAASGQYTWQVIPTISIDNKNATSNQSYTTTGSCALSWYQPVIITNTVYSPVNGASSTFISGTGTVAPVSLATQMSFVIRSITAGSDSVGTSYYSVTLLRPDGSQAGQWQNINTPQTISYYNPNETQTGQWQWVVYAYCTINTQNTSSYSDSMSGTYYWYTNVTTNYTTYANVNGPVSQFQTPSTTLAPSSPATELSFNISSLVAASGSGGSSSWTVKLYDPNSNLVQTYASLLTPQTLTYINPIGLGGVYTWTVQSIATNNATAQQTFNDTISATLGWYQAVTGSVTNYNVQPSTVRQYITPSTTTAPTTSLTQLTFVFNSLTLPSDANGNTFYNFTLQNPSGQVIQTWNNLTTTSTLSYYNASAIGGSYTLSWYSSVAKSGGGGSSTYNTAFHITAGWYIPNTSTINVYVNNNSGSVTNSTTSASTVAPITSNLALTFQVTAITVPSNSKGSTAYQVILKDPTGVQTQSWSVTGTQTLTYYNAGSVPGSYTWVVYSTCSNTGTGTNNFSTSIAATIGWYQSVTGLAYTYTNHNGSATTYKTPANTSAPTASSSQISLVLAGVVTPSNSNGSSYLDVSLFDPNNNPISAGTVTNITSPTTVSYHATGAISGVYTWYVYGSCSNTSLGPSAFTTSWTGNYSWYAPSSTANSVYVLASDGFTPRLTTNDTNIFFQKLNNSTAQFQITNNAAVPLTFQLGCESVGF